jgi:hypothetical protein
VLRKGLFSLSNWVPWVLLDGNVRGSIVGLRGWLKCKIGKKGVDLRLDAGKRWMDCSLQPYRF